jgi:hypothetical protein
MSYGFSSCGAYIRRIHLPDSHGHEMSSLLRQHLMLIVYLIVCSHAIVYFVALHANSKYSFLRVRRARAAARFTSAVHSIQTEGWLLHRHESTALPTALTERNIYNIPFRTNLSILSEKSSLGCYGASLNRISDG